MRTTLRFMAALVGMSFALAAISPSQTAVKNSRQATYCNPVDLPYRFRLEAPSRREAADPTIMTYRGEYWLFPSKSGGYWHSRDLAHWEFIQATGYPVEDYAPTVVVIGNKVYLAAGWTPKLYVADDLLAGQWTEAADFARTYYDPDLFLDDDGKLYVYYNIHGSTILHVTQLDIQNGFREIRSEDLPVSRNPNDRGWEIRGDFNELTETGPAIEGAWMNKHDGKYYLQYAAPGTEFKTYGDGVLVGDSPMGQFTYAAYSPFSFKPTGFIAGAGHSSTFAGLDGRLWHVATMTISVRHTFERRLGIFPTGFTKNGELVTDTYLGDYPHYLGGNRGLVGWMLLSRKKVVTASSAEENHEPDKAVDEEVRTWWSAKTGNAGEWLQIDLQTEERIDAVQINFADEGSTALGRSADVYKYRLEVSMDAKHWKTVVDHQEKGRDSPHDYEVLPQAVKVRYVRLENIHSPNGASFSVSDLRVFGTAGGLSPGRVSGVEALRDAADPRRVTVKWKPEEGAEFYVVRLGVSPNLLTQNYQIYDGRTTAEIRSLNVDVGYSVTVDAVNESGITMGRKLGRVHTNGELRR
jgi:xylan 1,4-beta-xylosidase